MNHSSAQGDEGPDAFAALSISMCVRTAIAAAVMSIAEEVCGLHPVPSCKGLLRSRKPSCQLSLWPSQNASAEGTHSQRYCRGLSCWQDSSAASAICVTSDSTASTLLAASTMCHVASFRSWNLCATLCCISSCPAAHRCLSHFNHRYRYTPLHTAGLHTAGLALHTVRLCNPPTLLLAAIAQLYRSQGTSSWQP